MNVNKPLYMKDDNDDWINVLLKNDYFKELNSDDNNLQSINSELEKKEKINPETEKIVKSVIDNIINKVVDNVAKEEREKIEKEREKIEKEREKMIKDMISDIINNVSQEETSSLYTDIERDLNTGNENEDNFYKNIFTDTLKLFGVVCGVKLVFDFLELAS
jgi:Na+/phosphate symporter